MKRCRISLSIRGMTFIELMFSILLVSAFAYIAFLSFRPTQAFHSVELSLAQSQHLVMALQAWQKVHGAWPGDESENENGNSCTDALEVMQQGQVAFIRGIHNNLLGSDYSFRCEPDNFLDPFFITQSVPLKYLDYVRRYLYQVEIPPVLPENENDLVEITSKVPPIDMSRAVYYAQVPMGHSQFEAPEATEAAARLAGSIINLELQSNQGFVATPPECMDMSHIQVGVLPSSVCPDLQPSELPAAASLELVVRLARGVVSREGVNIITIPTPVTARIQRVMQLDKIRYTTRPCHVRVNGSLECQLMASGADITDQDGWLIEANLDLEARFQVTYSVNGNLATARSLDLSADVIQNSQRLLDFVTHADTLMQVYGDAWQRYSIRDVAVQNENNYRDLFNHQRGSGLTTCSSDRPDLFKPVFNVIFHCAN